MKHLPFTIQAALILTVAVFQSSCLLNKPRTVNAAPPAPTPVAAPAPAPPPEPLSIPQTDVHLPPAQPVSPEAAATTQPPEETAGTPPARNPAKTQRQQPPTRPAETATPPQPSPSQPSTAPPPEPERPPIQEVTPAADLKRLQDEAAARAREVHQLIDTIDRRRLNRQKRGMLDRIESFLKQSDDAGRRGDMRQASELAQRALVLARELKP